MRVVIQDVATLHQRIQSHLNLPEYHGFDRRARNVYITRHVRDSALVEGNQRRCTSIKSARRLKWDLLISAICFLFFAAARCFRTRLTWHLTAELTRHITARLVKWICFHISGCWDKVSCHGGMFARWKLMHNKLESRWKVGLHTPAFLLTWSTSYMCLFQSDGRREKTRRWAACWSLSFNLSYFSILSVCCEADAQKPNLCIDWFLSPNSFYLSCLSGADCFFHIFCSSFYFLS